MDMDIDSKIETLLDELGRFKHVDVFDFTSFDYDKQKEKIREIESYGYHVYVIREEYGGVPYLFRQTRPSHIPFYLSSGLVAALIYVGEDSY
jgi:hypothetical protein